MKNILIVDDNKDILNVLRLGLCTCLKGSEILIASNGKQGCETLKQTSVDLIVTDLEMPVMNGFEFITNVRREHPDVPVCVIAGNCQPEVLERLQGMGVTKVITKPFVFDQLSEFIAKALGLGTDQAGKEATGHA